MNLTHEELHTLVGASTRLAAVLTLMKDPESKAALDPEQVNRDVLAALEKFKLTWTAARERGQRTEKT